MSTSAANNAQMKTALKEALIELFEERRDLFYALFKEVIEEVGLVDEAAAVLSPRPPTSLDDELEQIVDAEIAAYHQLHPMLLAEHAGEYVAIAEQVLVDHDVDKLALYRRIQARYPEQFVLVRRVDRMPEPELHIRSPRYDVPTS